MQARQERVAALLDDRGLDAALLTDPANLAWLTCGADLAAGAGNGGDAGGAGGPGLFLTHASRVVVCSAADSPHLFDREIPGLGFQLKERPWAEPLGDLFADLCRGRTVGTDAAPAAPRDTTRDANRDANREPDREPNGNDPTDLRAALAGFRSVLDREERAELAALGADAAHAVEAVCRGATAGRTECDLAGEVAHRLLRRGVTPAALSVAGDGRAERQPHYTFARRPAAGWAVVRAVGRRAGLHVHVCRTVVFRPGTTRTDRDALRRDHARALQIQAAGLHFGVPGADWAEVWPKLARVYEKTGPADDWRGAPVAVRTGFAAVEATPGPASAFALEAGTPLVWQPRCGRAACGDTALVGGVSGEDPGPAAVVTGMEEWPRLAVAVRGAEYERPGVLAVWTHAPGWYFRADHHARPPRLAP